MSRKLLLVLLLATGIALADDAAKKPAGAASPSHDKKKTTAARAKGGAEPKKAEGKEEEKAAPAEAKPEEKANVKEGDPDLGMSILGNQEAPKSLVIVPWKRSEIGDSLGISTMLDDSRQPIDKEVFMRSLSYYQVRTNTTRQDGAPAVNGPARPAAAAHRRKS